MSLAPKGQMSVYGILERKDVSEAGASKDDRRSGPAFKREGLSRLHAADDNDHKRR